MKWYRIDGELIRQIEAVLREMERIDPSYRVVSRALSAELKLLPRDTDLQDLNQDLMSGLLRTFDQMFGSDDRAELRNQDDSDECDEQICDFDELLRRTGLRTLR